MFPKLKGKNYSYLGRFKKPKFVKEGHNTYDETIQTTPVMPTGAEMMEQAAIRQNAAQPDKIPETKVVEQEKISGSTQGLQSRQGSYLGKLGQDS